MQIKRKKKEKQNVSSNLETYGFLSIMFWVEKVVKTRIDNIVDNGIKTKTQI